ncbi:large conductance mechanosensitive channel protein MscL [Planomicrobium sp. MB-3u-38]|uniref:large conductance mechanosensitive channel protein MscL n=1 Tax=Planomicrobium sp. MB-3u-38 TaxID=2058318 RepID=UPI000C7D6FD9|nr:large conductance mechanosensitive channel protein MscL [Planomicrobium sp. MB-3u-38]PKH08285.1 large conductance mechanosensitive channel protein MscL [Planomicrobium sp. MB-3u-38]
MWNDFKAFALKGNVLDLAIAVVIGAAFGKVVTSLVEDLIMPAVGMLLGGFSIADAVYKVGDATLKYGAFLQSVLDFLIISFSIFMVIRLFMKFRRKEEMPAEEVVPELDKKEELLVEIRELLKKQQL